MICGRELGRTSLLAGTPLIFFMHMMEHEKGRRQNMRGKNECWNLGGLPTGRRVLP